jgi:hypothetical protein
MRVGARVGLLSKRPVMMMVESRKVMEKQPFASIPQQSDYVEPDRQDAARSKGKRAAPTAVRAASHVLKAEGGWISLQPAMFIQKPQFLSQVIVGRLVQMLL